VKLRSRPAFNIADYNNPNLSEEARNQLLFDWWCDDGDRRAFIQTLNRAPHTVLSRTPIQIDPAPLLTDAPQQGFRKLVLLTDPAHIFLALTDSNRFSNAPYAALGGASFMLGMDPRAQGTDWHSEQREFLAGLLGVCGTSCLRQMALQAVSSAALTELSKPDFDLAQFAEQAALRYMATLFGYGFQDHDLLLQSSRATYRGLQYLAVGQHFCTEPTTLPLAQQALGRLIQRTSELITEYDQLRRAPWAYSSTSAGEFVQRTANWPYGVQPLPELGLSGFGDPLLGKVSEQESLLSGRDRALVVATAVAGTVGNIQSAVCLLVRALLNAEPDELKAVRKTCDPHSLERSLLSYMAKLPPIPVIPRRAREDLEDLGLEAGQDCLLLLEALPGCPHAHQSQACPRVWGDVARPGESVHGCLGQTVSMPLIAALVQHVCRLPDVQEALHPVSGEPEGIERLWGFACVKYPLRYEKERVRRQSNLIVSMRIKSPVSQNAARLSVLIAEAIPRIDHVLNGFGGVHFAWFEFSDDERSLVLRTVYDGPFEAYVQHFALFAGDLFDGLFEYLEDAPPRPVSSYPFEFVETLKRLNRGPLGGYLFSAYPQVTARQRRGLASPVSKRCACNQCGCGGAGRGGQCG
jgi:hypothetical protein